MKTELSWLVTGLVVGAAIVTVAGEKQYSSLKSYADSVAAASARSDSQSHQFSDSIKKVVAKLATQKPAVRTKLVKDSTAVATADSAVAAARSSSDTIAALQREVKDLKSEVADSKNLLAISESIGVAQSLQVDSLEKTVDALNQNVQHLTQRINSLHGASKWVKISLEVVKLSGVAYGGYQLGKHH